MNNLHIKVPLMLGLAGIGLLATHVPAHAVGIQYIFQGVNIPTNQSVTGSFRYDAGSNTYSDWNISLPSTTASAITYNPSTSSVSSPLSTGVSFNYTAAFPANPANTDSRTLVLQFQTALGPVGSTTLFDVTNPLPRSGEFIVADAGNTEVNRFFTTGASVQAVPLETDALPVAATTVLVAGSFWLRRRKLSQVNLDISPTPQVEKAKI